MQDYRESKYQGRTGALETSARLYVRVAMAGAVQGVQVSESDCSDSRGEREFVMRKCLKELQWAPDSNED